MKHRILIKLWLRVGMIVAIMTTALAGTVAAQTTYKLEQVTSVEAGGLYVFEQGGYVMNNECSSSALQTTNSYKTTGLTGSETYVWTLEAATDDTYYMKNINGTGNFPYLNNGSSTSVSFVRKTASTDPSNWSFSFQADNTVLIQNTNNNNRFLGWTAASSHVYKAYATSNLSSYPHAIKVYQLVEEGGDTPTPSITVAPTTIEVPAEGKDGTIEVTYKNITDVVAEVAFCDAEGEAATYDWVTAEVNSDNNVDYLIDANEGAARRAYFKVWAYDDDMNEVYSELITVTQAAYVAPVASITVTPTTIEVPAEEAEGTITVTYENITDILAEVKFYEADGTTEATYDWITADVNSDNNVDYLVEANEGAARTAYFRVWAYDDEMNEVCSELITVTQAAYVAPVADYATLPFEFDGGRADIANTAGLTQNDLGGDYGSSPKLKFDETGDYLVLHFNERPGKLTFGIKGNSFSGGTFKVQTSTNGTNWVDLETYTELDAFNEKFDNLGEDVRYIKWVYTEKVSGNVALGNIVLAAYNATPTTITAGTLEHVTIHELWDGNMDEIELGSSVAEGTTVFFSLNVEEGYEVESVTVVDENNESVTVAPNSGAWSFTMPNSSVTINVTAVAIPVAPITGDKYVKVTSSADLTDGQYLIVYEDGSLAFDGGLTTLDAVGNTISVTISNNEIAATNETTAAEFAIDVTAGTILSASGKYIGQTTDANGLLSADTYTNTISINSEGDADIISSGGAYLRYNSSSNQLRFRYYKSTSYTGQQAIQLYKYVKAVTLNSSGYATFASSSPIDFSGAEAAGYTAWTITSANKTTGVINFSKITGAVEAGTGVLLMGEAGETVYPVVTTSGETPANNLLVGITEATPVEANQYYGLKGDTFKKVNAGTVPAGKALLPVDVVGEVKTFTFNFEDDPTGISTVDNEQLTIDNVIYNIAGQRLKKMQKGINIVNGKKIAIK